MNLKRHIPKIAGTLIVLGACVLMVNMVRDFLDAPGAAPPRGPQQITLLTPPPPPPPPRVEEKPPEPKIEEEVKLEEPDPIDDLPDQVADDAPAGSELGVDAEGGAAGDAFGLIGRKGGRGLLDGAGDPFRYYASQLQRQIEDALLEQDAARRLAYTIAVNIWVNPDGTILRAELVNGTGSRQADEILVETIRGLQKLSHVPPGEMPQPIRMRISSAM
jgi:protein TonB